MKVIFASPTYGPVDPRAVISQRNVIMHAASNGHTWLGDASPDRMKFDAARNGVVRSVLESPEGAEADYVFWCDSDMILPAHAVTSLLSPGLDFVTGIYFQRYPPHWPLIANYNTKRQAFSWFTGWPEDSIAPIDGCGFGCVITSIKMLRAMDDPWFTFEKFSEDFNFCLSAARKGFQLHVHTGVICGHLADSPSVTIDDFQREYARYREEHPQ